MLSKIKLALGIFYPMLKQMLKMVLLMESLHALLLELPKRTDNEYDDLFAAKVIEFLKEAAKKL